MAGRLDLIVIVVLIEIIVIVVIVVIIGIIVIMATVVTRVIIMTIGTLVVPSQARLRKLEKQRLAGDLARPTKSATSRSTEVRSGITINIS